MLMLVADATLRSSVLIGSGHAGADMGYRHRGDSA